jgi:hypothetical protein
LINIYKKIVFILLLLLPTSTVGEDHYIPTIEDIEVPFNKGASTIIDENDDIHRVWYGIPDYNEVEDIIYYQKMHHSTWGPIVQLPREGVDENHSPDLAIDSNNNVHIIWIESSSETTGANISYVFLNATTNRWSKPYTTGSYQIVTDLSITIDSQDLGHVVWSQGMMDGIYYKYYNISEEFWSKPVKISSTYNEPVVAIDGMDNIHVISKDDEIYHTMFNNTEKTWGTSYKIITSSLLHGTLPTVAIGEDTLHLAWVEKHWDITEQVSSINLNHKKYMISTNSWTPAEIISVADSTHLYRYVWKPILQLDHLGNVHIVWNVMTYVSYSDEGVAFLSVEVFLASYEENDQNWNKALVVSINNTQDELSTETFLVDSNNNLLIFWYLIDQSNLTSQSSKSNTTTYHILILSLIPVLLIRKKAIYRSNSSLRQSAFFFK